MCGVDVVLDKVGLVVVDVFVELVIGVGKDGGRVDSSFRCLEYRVYYVSFLFSVGVLLFLVLNFFG